MKKTPLIGIVSKEYDIHFNEWHVDFISNEVRYALTKNGARVIGILPPQQSKLINPCEKGNDLTDTEKKQLDETLSICDGIVIQGGLDRFAYEEYIVNYALKNNVPLLGICDGLSTIVSATGGTVQKLEANHEHYHPELKYSHTINIDKNSQFYKIVKTEIMRVNSIHNYTIINVKNNEIVGKTTDGLIEITENPTQKFHIGIHFHPELLVDEDNYMNAIFTAFIDVAS